MPKNFSLKLYLALRDIDQASVKISAPKVWLSSCHICVSFIGSLTFIFIYYLFMLAIYYLLSFIKLERFLKCVISYLLIIYFGQILHKICLQSGRFARLALQKY